MWAEKAVSIRGTHSENLLTLALVAEATGKPITARDALVDVIRRKPWITAAPSWALHFPRGEPLESLIAAADGGWDLLDETDPRFPMPQAYWRPPSANLKHMPNRFRNALQQLTGCDPQGAVDKMFEDPTGNWSDAGLEFTIMASRLAGEDDRGNFASSLSALRGGRVTELVQRDDWPDTSPYRDTGEDNRLYRLFSVAAPALSLKIPSADEGLHAWIHDPAQAAMVGAPGSALAECSS